MSPNAFAYLALLVWPVASFAMFRFMGPRHGLLACIIGGYLLLPPLPTSFELPALPSLNKHTIPAFSALVICLALFLPVKDLLPRGPMARVLLGACFLSSLVTLVLNMDPLLWGSFWVTGMRIPEVVPNTLALLAELLPFLLGRALLKGEAGLREFLWAIAIATFAYSFPMLVEVRLSPQINTWVYGFFQHDFGQMMRGSGFRPIVFLYHGLWVAFLTATAILAAATIVRSGSRKAVFALFLVVWLLAVLVLCKSMASLIYALLGLPVILLFSPRMQINLAAIIAVLLLFYPALRYSGVIPTDYMVQTAERVSADRAQSLEFRFDNEDSLLARAMERPLFGWGGWGRNQIREADSGRITSVTDGLWVILIGVNGIVGYIAKMGLLCLPILLTWRRRKQSVPPLAAGGMLILAINLVDMIPNATLTPLTWLAAGALLSWAEQPSASQGMAPVPARPLLPVVLGGAPRGGIRTVL
ncbi:hypothetical protein [Rubellimicrobium arenae]|uniref:hypothetical protein n=1 Tax=Rubellimicrobium arenae TaxID=2817372 RepID=UPI001B316A31|nr:hypothetical protein [Rubellimicrobium arenae]